MSALETVFRSLHITVTHSQPGGLPGLGRITGLPNRVFQGWDGF